MKDIQIIMLGTGNAGVTRCYNTCFAIRTAENVLLVDAGGGNGILVQLEKAGIAMAEADVTMIPQTYVELTDPQALKDLNRTLDLLDDDDDVQYVYTNLDE